MSSIKNKVTSNSRVNSSPLRTGMIFRDIEDGEYFILCKSYNTLDDLRTYTLQSLIDGNLWTNPVNDINDVFGSRGYLEFERVIGSVTIEISGQ